MVENKIVFLAGKTGCGKSFTLNHLIHREVKLKRRDGIVILDFRADHINLLEQKDFRYLRISGDISNNYDIDWEAVLGEYPYLIIEPHKLSREGYEQLADDIAGGLVNVGNRVFILEESHLAFPVHTSIKRNLSVLITTGRKIGLDFFFTAQRPSLVNSTAISQANIRISFILDDINDIQRMRGHFPPEVDLTKLKRFEMVGYNVFTHQKVQTTTNNLEKLNPIF